MLALAMIGTPAIAQWDGSSSEDGNQGAVGAANARFDYGSTNEYDSTQKKISAMNVLLPISNCAECRKVTFELIASNGCYIW